MSGWLPYFIESRERYIIRPLNYLLVVKGFLAQGDVPLAQSIRKMQVIDPLVARLIESNVTKHGIEVSKKNPFADQSMYVFVLTSHPA